MKILNLKGIYTEISIKTMTCLLFLLASLEHIQAQDGGRAGIEEATNMITGYFDPAVKLIYAIGMLCGLVGGIKVFSKVQGGDPDAGKSASMWFFGCVFLVVVATVLKSFFR